MNAKEFLLHNPGMSVTDLMEAYHKHRVEEVTELDMIHQSKKFSSGLANPLDIKNAHYVGQRWFKQQLLK